jgi:hypothetical protein
MKAIARENLKCDQCKQFRISTNALKSHEMSEAFKAYYVDDKFTKVKKKSLKYLSDSGRKHVGKVLHNTEIRKW